MTVQTRMGTEVIRGVGSQPAYGSSVPRSSALTNSWQCSSTLWRDPHAPSPTPASGSPSLGPSPALTSLVGVVVLGFSRE